MVCEDVPRSYKVDDAFLMRAADVSEALTNLAYLMRVDANDPERVRMYVSMAEERLRTLGRLLHSVAEESQWSAPAQDSGLRARPGAAVGQD